MIRLEGPIHIIDYDEELSVFRAGEIAYIEGKVHHYDKSKFCITCNVQPMGRDLLLVPEADRYKEQYTVYARGEHLKGNDRVVRHKKSFQVQNLENWGSYQKARIMLDDVGEHSYD